MNHHTTPRVLSGALALAGSLFTATAAPAQSGGQVTITSKVMVERVVTVDGRTRTVLEPPRSVTPGDRLVFTLGYRNGGARPAVDFTATNPIPASVAYAGDPSPGATVSVDGGRSWGALAALTVPGPNGTRRPARAEDVTHVRWRMAQPVPVGGGGSLTFRGYVK